MATAPDAAGFDPLTTIDGRRHRVTLGLRRLNLADWLLADEHADEEIAHKKELLATQPSEVLRTMPEAAAASEELLAEIVANLAVHHPGRPRQPDPTVDPLQAAALLVQEDLCLLTRGQHHWELTAACVCFPSRWALADKIGASVAAIHDPVPDYAQIAGPVDSFFDRLSVDRPMWRTNWTLTDDPALHQPRPAAASVADPGSWTFRVERQTLRRLPDTGAAVFTIRTYQLPLTELVQTDPTAARTLAATLTTTPPDWQAYRSWDDLAALVEWLRAHG